MTWMDGPALILTLALVPPFLMIAATTLAALEKSRHLGRTPTFRESNAPRLAFVIPAHDEEPGIAATVRSCVTVDYPSERLQVYVIADNCSDQTAQVARNAGATVFERTDPIPEHKTKGHALETFFRDAPGWGDHPEHDAAVIVDADTLVDSMLLRHFAQSLQNGEDWLQGYYGVRNPDASWRTRLLALAFALRNGVTPMGQDRLGLSVGLQGNGMCFSTRGLSRVPWRAYGLVEDMEFALMLRSRGERVRFLPEARVYGEMVSRGGTAATSQRQRWEAGRRSLRSKFFRPILQSPTLGWFHKLLYLVDLLTPPLATLGLGLGLAVGATFVSMIVSQPHDTDLRRILLAILACMGAILASYVGSPLFALQMPARYLRGLVMLPIYMAWKLVASAGKTPRTWVRTDRESTSSDSPS